MCSNSQDGNLASQEMSVVVNLYLQKGIIMLILENQNPLNLTCEILP